MIIFRTLLLALLISPMAWAQEAKTRPATDQDFAGYWRIRLIPNEVHRSEIKNERTGYADPCQFFLHHSDGTWWNISISRGSTPEEARKICPTLKKADIDQMQSLRGAPRYEWLQVKSAAGVYIVREKKAERPAGLIWKADYIVDDDASAISRGWEIRKGSMLMHLMRVVGPGQVTPAWPMILEPVLE